MGEWTRRQGKEKGKRLGETHWHVLVTFPIAGDNVMAFTLEAFGKVTVREWVGMSAQMILIN